MTKPIEVGCLVMVVSAMRCCGHPTGAEGVPFTVEALEYFDVSPCKFCGQPDPAEFAARGFEGRHPIGIKRLIRIDDPAQDTTTETELELTI